jgi:putative ABC transport system ATP-binding protein
MRKRWVLAGAAVLVAVAATGGVVAMSSAQHATPAAQAQPANTVNVVRGKLSAMVSMGGTLTYRARSDGSPYPVINHARGTYTWLPDVGDKVACGGVLSRVDDKPVLLLCGAVPAYRDLHSGDLGNDIRQLNQNLHTLGYDAGVGIDPSGNRFTWKTQKALEVLQHDKDFAVTGRLALDDAVFLPDSVRIAKVTGELGGSAQPGAPVLDATTDTPEVQVDLAPSQQGQVRPGDRAQITLPGNTSVTGKVDRLGRVAQVPPGQNNNAGDATIPAYISLDVPDKARGLDKAPVQVEITTEGVDSALERPGHRDRREVRRRVRGRGRADRRATRAGRGGPGPVRHHSRTSRGQGRPSRRRSRGGAVAMSGEPVLELDGVSKVYGEEPPVPALRGVSFSVRQGELVAIVGPSGSGKSTLLHVIGTLERPTSGVVRVGGVGAAGLSDRELSRLRGREIGFVFQQFFLAEHATVRENVAEGLLYAGVPAAGRHRRADEALERVGLAARANFKPTKLSGGERQRVAIARALVGRPAIVLADEPTGNLDSTTGASIMALIRELNAAGATIIMITHDAGLADQLPRQIRMLDGQVVADAGPDRGVLVAPMDAAGATGEAP